jgi:hypothetical protein
MTTVEKAYLLAMGMIILFAIVGTLFIMWATKEKQKAENKRAEDWFK